MRLFDFFRKKKTTQTDPPEANLVLPGESLGQFHRRIYRQYSASLKAPAVKMLRAEIPETVQQDIREAIAKDPEHWATPYHFWWGMSIRNLLREKGFGEDYWPIWNLDDIYVSLVEDAVKQ